MEEKYGIHFTEELLTAPGFGPMTREVMDTVQSVLDMNDPVGLAAGYYTDRLPIVCASRFFAEMLGYERERLGQEPGLKLEDIICTTLRYPFEKRDFSALWGKFRVYMLTQKGAAVLMTCFKEETRDAQGRPMWVISARPSRTEQYLTLVEDIREISQWYIDYDRAGQVTQVHWDDDLRALLADPPGTPLPGSKGLGERIHPEDRPRIRKELTAFFFDPGRDRFMAECRLLLGSGGRSAPSGSGCSTTFTAPAISASTWWIWKPAASKRRRFTLPFGSWWKTAPIGMLWPRRSAKNMCCRNTGIWCCSAAAGIISARF